MERSLVFLASYDAVISVAQENEICHKPMGKLCLAVARVVRDGGDGIDGVVGRKLLCLDSSFLILAELETAYVGRRATDLTARDPR